MRAQQDFVQTGARSRLPVVTSPEETAIEIGRRKLERGEADSGVAAVALKDITAPDEDGISMRVLVTDGERSRRLKVSVSGTTLSTEDVTLSDETLERAVEHRAGRFDREGDRPAAVSARPIGLRVDELYAPTA